MAGLEAINSQSLYFASLQNAVHQQAKETTKGEKSSAAKKTSFASSLKKNQEEFELANEGLPIELAGKTVDEAIVFLKDEVDLAGDMLAQNPNMEQIENYRKKLGNFIKYVSKNNYQILTHARKYKGRSLLDKKTGKPAYFVQIKVINEKLAQLTNDILYNHRSNIEILKRVEEINGLIVDLLAV
ncbi:YaaR family protein [Treponema pectinovorum]|uniref:YaaR family protein n=1 Tax=Treponema pectinovorum TaxID=164 RepID=UPI003D8B0742